MIVIRRREMIWHIVNRTWIHKRHSSEQAGLWLHLDFGSVIKWFRSLRLNQSLFVGVFRLKKRSLKIYSRCVRSCRFKRRWCRLWNVVKRRRCRLEKTRKRSQSGRCKVGQRCVGLTGVSIRSLEFRRFLFEFGRFGLFVFGSDLNFFIRINTTTSMFVINLFLLFVMFCYQFWKYFYRFCLFVKAVNVVGSQIRLSRFLLLFWKLNVGQIFDANLVEASLLGGSWSRICWKQTKRSKARWQHSCLLLGLVGHLKQTKRNGN